MISDAKVKDKLKGKKKFFETIPHDSAKEKIRECTRCKCDIAENSLIAQIDAMDDNSTSGDKNPLTGAVRIMSFKELRVVRGNLDDCIGWVTIFG